MRTNEEPQRKWKVTGGDDAIESELASFINMIGLDRIAPGRYSLILVLHLFGGWKSGFQEPGKIIREIEALEAGVSTGLKAPIQNRHPPLKGLWHKHYLQDGLPSLAKNIQLALKKYGMPYFEQKICEAEEAGEVRFMTAEDLMAVANDVVHGNLGRRREDEAMTGEWLLFAKHEGENYYLAVTTHDSSAHPQIRQQIDTICCHEFPFLIKLLAEA
ncbi:hypothetical protein [Cupriavidus consociatus]|uniref:hypothetical protein n=1 Tax=Cupriavidus consociatus TaxID=2821357 RepID=UPI001AE1FCE3|nr:MULTISPECIES: hypothetical protein [unclassified Cupriavidus]MBP0624016.1 hypothetical protein [Cupriavidus sp. LEh25]MDK2660726.1 hypothetical protein [Cupriavidus sp. LEh21]